MCGGGGGGGGGSAYQEYSVILLNIDWQNFCFSREKQQAVLGFLACLLSEAGTHSSERLDDQGSQLQTLINSSLTSNKFI